MRADSPCMQSQIAQWPVMSVHRTLSLVQNQHMMHVRLEPGTCTDPEPHHHHAIGPGQRAQAPVLELIHTIEVEQQPCRTAMQGLNHGIIGSGLQQPARAGLLLALPSCCGQNRSIFLVNEFILLSRAGRATAL